MNNEELKKKIAQIIANYFCPQSNEHKSLWGDDRLCYSKMNFAECERVTECTDALIAAGIGDMKEVEKEYRNTMLLAVKCQTLASERSRYMELNKNIAEYRAARAERAGKIAASKVFDYTYEEAVAQAEKELAEEGKDENY